MNLYDLHSKPETLKGYEQRFQIPHLAYEEAQKIWDKTGKRIPKLEQAIAKDPKLAYQYANEVIMQKFPLGEPVFAKDPELAFNYAQLSNERFRLGEPTIATDPKWAYLYAFWVVKKRWPEGEPILKIGRNWRYRIAYEDHFKVKLK